MQVRKLSKENRSLINQLKALNENISLLTKVTAISVGKETIFKGKERKEEKLAVLDDLNLPDEITALLIGSTPESVRALRSRRKAKTAKPTKEIEFHAEDLQGVLRNETMFPSTLDLIDFAKSILGLSPELFDYNSKDKMIEQIIKAFQDSDPRRQALFIQALERRATVRALKDTEFLRFFEGWEAHIKG
jgi:hypothetical protein